MSEEVASAFVERRAFEAALNETEQHRAAEQALQSQLAASHEALLLAEADVETLVTKVRALFTAPTFDARGQVRLELRQLIALGHPGHVLADEVAQTRALVAQGKQLADAVQAYFNRRGATVAVRRDQMAIIEMAEALADYGFIEQQQAGAT